MASLDSLARHAGSAWVSFPASFPESVLRRCEESQKQPVYSGQAVDYLLALASDFRPARSLGTLGPESPMALERSDSAGSLSAHLATVSLRESPSSSVFRPVLSENRQVSRQVSPLAKHQAFRKVWIQAGSVERASFLQPLHLAKHPE